MITTALRTVPEPQHQIDDLQGAHPAHAGIGHVETIGAVHEASLGIKIGVGRLQETAPDTAIDQQLDILGPQAGSRQRLVERAKNDVRGLLTRFDIPDVAGLAPNRPYSE